MTLPPEFFDLHRDLPREGPGEPADVHWALSVAGTSGAARLCDAGCGPGADTETLAEALSDARIEAVDMVPHFVAEARARTARFGDRVSVRQGDMGQLAGPYDLIWSAGAVYFLGVTEALSTWLAALAPGGRIAFSEPVLLSDPPPAAVTAFWSGEAEVTGLEGLTRRIEAAGCRLLGHRLIIGAPWAAYYQPMEARIAKLRAKGTSEAMETVLREAEREIALWRAAPDQIAYALCVVAPQ